MIKVTHEPSKVPFSIVTDCDGTKHYYTPAAAKELRDKLDKAIKKQEKLTADSAGGGE